MNSLFDAIIRFGYSNDLHEHLKGLDTKCNDYTATSIYQLILWTIIGLGLLVMLNYYRGLFHRPKFTSRWFWLLNILAVSIVVFVLAYFRSTYDLSNGNFCKDLSFNTSDCLLFALTSATYAFIFCAVISLLLKLVSIHHKRIPF
ncbi:MAG: hypothetical protein EOO43_19225 [Flavobacterium sp.]|nr:MAG: hypothetical protein EOO43_19225 [Flavobacterium sp.]